MGSVEGVVGLVVPVPSELDLDRGSKDVGARCGRSCCGIGKLGRCDSVENEVERCKVSLRTSRFDCSPVRA